MSRADDLALNDKKVHDLVLRGTPGQFDSTEALATTEFVQRAIGSYAGQTNYPGDTALTAADVGRLSNFPQLSTVTLPPASKVAPGGLVMIASSLQGGVTVKPAAGDSLANVSGTPGPFSIQVGTIGVFRRLLGGNGWGFDGGDAALRYSPMFTGPNWLTQPQFTSDKSFATTEFVRRQGKQYSGSTALNNNGSIPASAAGQIIVLFGDTASTINLPATSDLPNGATFTVICYNTVSAGITRIGNDLIYGADPGQSVSVKNIRMTYGDILELSFLGAGAWYVSGGNIVGNNIIPQFDVSNRLASTGFVQRALGNYNNVSILSSAANLTKDYFGRVLLLNSGTSFTVKLPPSSSAPTGSVISIRNVGSVDVAVVPSGNDSLAVVATIPLTSMVVKPGSSFDVVLQGTTYYMCGTSTLRLVPEFASYRAANGWKVDPSELMEQWGVIPAIPAGGSVLVNFPVAFNSGAIGYALASGGSGAGVPGVNVNNVSASQVRFWNQSNTASTQAGGYRVIGY